MVYKSKVLLLVLMFYGTVTSAQRFLTDMMDTTTSLGKGLFPLYEQYDRLRFGGYMQPQFQWAEDKGVKNYSGGDFPANVSNRFMLRRGRVRIDYSHYNAKSQPLAFFAFQFDGTERGVAIRDFWGRFYENKLQLLSLTAGMFARPMGFEVNYSSSEREAPERGRMSQTLMRTERDLGFMLTFESRKKVTRVKWLKVDLGVFNGQGLAGPAEYDNHKDIIGRFSLKPQTINKYGWIVSGSLSGYLGGITSQSTDIYEYSNGAMRRDSAQDHLNYVTPRQYAGGDVQLKIPNRHGFTELRAEYIRGKQTATLATSETPGTYPFTSSGVPQPLYIRNFDGAYFYLIHNISHSLQAVLKYDWYDPNKKVKGQDIKSAQGFSSADLKYGTLGSGVVYKINDHVKATAWYDWIHNEVSGITGFEKDLKDNIFTFRLQYRF